MTSATPPTNHNDAPIRESGPDGDLTTPDTGERLRPVRMLSQYMTHTIMHYCGLLFDQLLALPAIDRAFQSVLRRPRLLQLLLICIGIGAIAFALLPLFNPVPVPIQSQIQTAVPVQASRDEGLYAVITGYNQASIAASLTNKPEIMRPFVNPGSKLWDGIEREYAKRMAQGTTKELSLIRWGVMRTTMSEDGATAQVMTQEQWDSVGNIAGQITSSNKGMIFRNTYTLQRDPQQGIWLLEAITSEVAVQ